MFTSFGDYKKEDGSTDWAAYRQAQRANGETCSQCDTYIVHSKGHESLCYDCKSLSKKDECSHETYIRCPYCQELRDIRYSEEYEIFHDGEHEVQCYKCNKKFEITTYVSYEFLSPPIIKEETEESTQSLQTDAEEGF